MKKIIGLLLIIMFAYVGYAGAADITLQWNANSETDLAGYNLYYKTDIPESPYDGTGATEGSSPVDIPLAVLTDINNPEYTLTNLDAAHVYFLVLTAYDDGGNESGYSNEVSTFYISSPQNGFYVNSTNYMAFNISGRGAAGYEVRVYSDGTLVGTVTTGVDGAWSADCDFATVAEGTVNVSARTTVINELTSNTVTGELDITAPGPPRIPTGLRADVVSASQINLEWEAVDGATGYAVYRDDAKLCDIDTNSYNDYDLEPSTPYEYEVASFYDVDDPSERSELVSATTLSNDDNPPSTGGGSSGGSGCFISSTEKIEKALIKITFSFFLLSILAFTVIGLAFVANIVSKFDSDIRTIIDISVAIIFLVIIFAELANILFITVAVLSFVGGLSILITAGKTILSAIKMGDYGKC